MAIYEVDPLKDSRWHELTQRDGRASMFHSIHWLESLRRTYGYQPIVYTTSSPSNDLRDTLVSCHVKSWLTGRRVVSLPFSDHCEPLVETVGGLGEILSHVQDLIKQRVFKYFELRPLNTLPKVVEKLTESDRFAFHKVDLRRSEDELFKNLHKDSIRRKVQRAERDGLTYEKGSTEEFVRKFYHLFVMTRRKHGVPPSPFAWFQNLTECFGKAAEIRVASKDGVPVAALFTVSHNKSIVYKYGASDARLSNHGGTPFLFWKTITEAKSQGFEDLDLGRSEEDNHGLITFKERLGGIRSELHYQRISLNGAKTLGKQRGIGLANKLFTAAPDAITVGLGTILYRHLG